MIYSIENEQLKIDVNSYGAQLFSVYSKKSKTEYLWQGDPAFWKDRAHNLFPFIGRMYEGVFHYDGKEYPSRAHGLARYFEFALESKTENSLVFLLKDNEDTRKEYPFAFEYRVTFILNGTELVTHYEVTNTDDKTLICTFGGHPGINIPFGEGVFEDYYLEFSEKKAVTRQLLDETDSFMAEKSVPYELVDGTKIPLRHELFTHDAVILENTCGEVAIKCDKESRYVSMKYSDFKFIGFWQVAKPEAPYVCLEPWDALPAVAGKIVDLETKPHMTHVGVGEKAEASFTLTIHE
ncbi:MAG: aldose 1-epimerase family protein [Clostridia bacterium]|nr:aldose 1-epimerase family protein [Clostridia bacterium]